MDDSLGYANVNENIENSQVWGRPTNYSFIQQSDDSLDDSFFNQTSRTSRTKLIHDPIWGYMRFNKYIMAIVDTPQFQRLRDLNQLGSSYYIYPGASHKRFEHSLGTCHVAGQMLANIRNSQPELDITPRDVLLVQLAALCHDLGHGPFSHVFDHEVIPAAFRRVEETTGQKPKPWTHEDASEMMLEAAITEARLDEFEAYEEPITKDEILFIKELINPERYPIKKGTKKLFLYDVVSNSRCSIDVDKFDYLARDSYNVGIKNGFDARRLMIFCRVIDDEICFDKRAAFSVYELFHTRYSLFKQIYSHRAGKSIEYMIRDVLLLADPVLHITERIRTPEQYLTLSDNILLQVEVSSDPRLEEARALIQRIRKRDLYSLVFEAALPPAYNDQIKSFKDIDIVKYHEKNRTNKNIDKNIEITTDDIIVQTLKLDYGKKGKNPVDFVRFYNRPSDAKGFYMNKNEISVLTPSVFQECWIRVYCRTADSDKYAAIKLASRAYFQKEFGDLPTNEQVEPQEFDSVKSQHTTDLKSSPIIRQTTLPSVGSQVARSRSNLADRFQFSQPVSQTTSSPIKKHVGSSKLNLHPTLSDIKPVNSKATLSLMPASTDIGDDGYETDECSLSLDASDDEQMSPTKNRFNTIEDDDDNMDCSIIAGMNPKRSRSGRDTTNSSKKKLKKSNSAVVSTTTELESKSPRKVEGNLRGFLTKND